MLFGVTTHIRQVLEHHHGAILDLLFAAALERDCFYRERGCFNLSPAGKTAVFSAVVYNEMKDARGDGTLVASYERRRLLLPGSPYA
jgi:Zn-dependent M16 (insulinase) family peptidase